ncbi:MAG: TatD family hydrolase [Candidatus Neomarinimicrobiota bacterium]
MLIDSHCHLFYPALKNDLPAVLERAGELGVTRFISVGTNLEDSRLNLKLAEKYENIFAAAGIHPHDAEAAPRDFIKQLEEIIRHPKIVAVGEMGLDYYRNISAPHIQKKIFSAQLELAAELGKPVIFHNREADKDVLDILKIEGKGQGVAHCFSSSLETGESFINLGYYISFSGNLTFKNSSLVQVVKNLPIDKILVETDSPYLSPVPYRGRPNEPSRTRFVADKIAEIKKLTSEAVDAQTTENTIRLFNLPEKNA